MGYIPDGLRHSRAPPSDSPDANTAAKVTSFQQQRRHFKSEVPSSSEAAVVGEDVTETSKSLNVTFDINQCDGIRESLNHLLPRQQSISVFYT